MEDRNREQLLKTLLPEGTQVHSVAFSPDGETFATRTTKAVCLYSALTGEQLSQLPIQEIEAHDSLNQGFYSLDQQSFYSLAFSPDSKTMFVGLRDKAYLYDTRTKELLALKPSLSRLAFREHIGIIRSGTFSPDGRTILIILDSGTAHLLEVKTGKQLLQIGDSSAQYHHACAFSPDSKTVILTEGPLKAGIVYVWSSLCDASSWIMNSERNLLEIWFIIKVYRQKKITGSLTDDEKSLEQKFSSLLKIKALPNNAYTINEGSFEHKIFMGLPDYVQEYLMRWYSIVIKPL